MPRIRHYELGLLAGVVLIVMALGGVIARDLRRSADDAAALHDRLARGVDRIAAMQFTMQEVRRILLYALHTSDANRQLEYAEQSRSADARVRDLLDDHVALDGQPGGIAAMKNVEAAWNRYLAVRDEVIGLILEGSLSEGVALDEHEGMARFNEAREALAILNDNFVADARAQVEAAKGRARDATLRLTVLVVSALFGAAIGIYLVNRRAGLERLLHIEAHKGSILQAVPDPIISTDAAGRIIELNDATSAVFGLARSEALGASVDEIVLSRDRRGELTALLAAPAEGPRGMPHRFETVAARRDGSTFPADVAAVMHQAGTNRIWTIHVSDITERHRAEQDLRVARDRAEVAARAQSDFLANMSHELRTPLNGVIGIADLLQRADLAPRQRELMGMLRSSATALLELVSDVLDYSRIEQGLMDLKPVAFSVRECVEAALDTVAEPAARKGLELGYLVDATVPASVVADEGRVRQVLLNLLSNAVKFTEAGEVAVRVGARRRPGGRVEIAVAVQDSGPGIPGHLQHRLFQRFTQIDSTLTRRHGGAGLGLAISERLSRLLGGSLEVESREGEGATFQFTFSAVAVVEAGGDPSDTPLGGVTVLLSVRPGILRDQLHALLSRWDVIALDIDARLPGSVERLAAVVAEARADGGVWLARAHEHRDRAAAGHVPIVVIGEPLDGTPEVGLASIVAKPVHAARLHDTLLSVVTRAPSAPEARDDTPVVAPPAPTDLAVLVAEDNEFNCRVLQMMLRELGITADAAASGFEAIEHAAARDYDVIFMDVHMPGLDGIEAARLIRRRQSGKRPLIVALTANVMIGEDARCLEAGMDSYLSKPLRLETLGAVLRPFTTGAR